MPSSLRGRSGDGDAALAGAERSSTISGQRDAAVDRSPTLPVLQKAAPPPIDLAYQGRVHGKLPVDRDVEVAGLRVGVSVDLPPDASQLAALRRAPCQNG